MKTVLDKFLILFLGIAALCGTVNATNYYVATNGNNSNPGTEASPWLTVQHAAENVLPGDSVFIRSGTYIGWNVLISGTAGNSITFLNYPGELPIVDGNNYALGGIDIRASYITIEGIRVQNIKGDGIHIEGTLSNGTPHPITDVTIRYCQVDGTSNAGIYCAGLIMGKSIPVDEYRVFNVTIENNDITKTNNPSGGNECISLGGGTNGFIIRNNYVHDSDQYGIDVKFGGINGEIYSNVIHDMEKHGIYIDTNSRTIENIDIYNNFIYNCGANGLTLARESARTPKVPMLRNIRIFDNVFTGCRRGILAYIHPNDALTGDFKDITIVNNTLHDNNLDFDARSIKIWDITKVENHGGWIIANNLVSENEGTAANLMGDDWIVSNNVVSETDAPYVDADNLDFHLAPGSIAEDSASELYQIKSTDFDGVTRSTPPDAGAFEFVSGGASLPNAPSSLEAKSVSSSEIFLSWKDNAGNETGYKVERKTGEGSYSEIAKLVANVKSYSDSELSPSTNYTYRVSAFNEAGVSTFSNEDSSTTLSGPAIPNAPTSLSATAVSSGMIALSWIDNADDEDGFKVERKEGTGSYIEIVQLLNNVTNYSDTGLSASVTYSYRVRAYNTAGSSSYSNEVSAATPVDGGELPSNWANQDIGQVSVAGSAEYYSSSGTFTVHGSGADVWGTADELHYVYQQVSGDVEIKARIASQEDTHNWSKSGVMIRETLSTGSKQAHMFITPNYGFNFQWRTETDSISSSSSGVSTNSDPNNWVRLVRSGNSISAYSSPNGTNWTRVGSQITISMNATVYVGMSVCSHSDGILCTTEFDKVQVIGDVTAVDEFYEGENSIQDDFSLTSYPNPFNPTTSVQFAIPTTSDGKKVLLKAYDVLGRTVATLADGYISSGKHEILFDASGLSSGMYIFRMQSGERALTHCAILIK